MFENEKKLSYLLLRAQNASDGGKGQFHCNVSSKKAIIDNKTGYALKKACVYEAINVINTDNEVPFHYVITTDVKKHAKFIVYFEGKIGDKSYQSYQIAFHSNDERLSQYIDGREVIWKKKSSRKSVEAIYRYYFPSGNYI